MENVTNKYQDVNEHDQIYRTDNGRHVKVRVAVFSATPTAITLLITGSWVDDKTGKAKQFNDDYFIVDPHELVIKAESETDINEAIKNASELMVKRVGLAADNYYAISALKGQIKGGLNA